MNEADIKASEVRVFLKHAVLTSAAIALLASALSIALGSSRMAISIASGWIISLASFVVLAITVLKAFAGRNKASSLWALLGILKLLILGVILWWLLTNGVVEPLAFLGGFSTMVLSLAISGIRFRHGKPKTI